MSAAVMGSRRIERLDDRSLVKLPAAIARPLYDREKTGVGILHLGPGAFFRGHQAWYTEQALKHGGDWMISAVSLHSSSVHDALTPQNGLYTLAVIDAEPRYEIIGSIKEVLVAGQHDEQIRKRLLAKETRFVTLTITEKGYCLKADGRLDFEHPDILRDLDAVRPGASAIGILAHALCQRWQHGVKPFCVIPCDNLTHNGKKLRAALIAFMRKKYPACHDELSKQLVCPNTMVDSITPASNEALRSEVSEKLGLDDAWPIKREAFCQWIIEDVLPEPKPAWREAGVIYTRDVEGFEKAKLRLLNAPHSSLAYIGSLLGLGTVYEGMQHEGLQHFVRQLVREEISGSFNCPPELDEHGYAEDIFQRFLNPGIHHLLAQIAWDGSQKLPMRLLPIIEDNLISGRPVARLAFVIAAWFQFLRLRHRQSRMPLSEIEAQAVKLVDPLADKLLAIAEQCNGNAAHDIALWLDLPEVFSEHLQQNPVFRLAVQHGYALTGDGAPLVEILRQGVMSR